MIKDIITAAGYPLTEVHYHRTGGHELFTPDAANYSSYEHRRPDGRAWIELTHWHRSTGIRDRIRMHWHDTGDQYETGTSITLTNPTPDDVERALQLLHMQPEVSGTRHN